MVSSNITNWISQVQEPLVPKLVDTLALDQEHEIMIEVLDDKRMVVMDYKTLQYLSKKNRYIRDATKKVNQLFLRLEVFVSAPILHHSPKTELPKKPSWPLLL